MMDPLQYTTSDWSLADTEYDRVRRALDEESAWLVVSIDVILASFPDWRECRDLQKLS